MTFYYFDTDAFVKLLIPEVGHDKCTEILNDNNSTLISSNFTALEVHSALNVLYNRKEISSSLFERAKRTYNSIITNNEKVMTIPVTAEHYNKAVELVKETGKLRPGDSLQLALALEYVGLQPVFVSGDGRLLRAAEAKGLRVLNVNQCLCPNCGARLSPSTVETECVHCGHKDVSIVGATCASCGTTCNFCNSSKWCERILRLGLAV